MTSRYLQTLFSPSVKAVQSRQGSRHVYARHDDLPREADVAGPAETDALGEPEVRFLQNRDSLYMATVGHLGWPYVQHRGGPRGFVKVLDSHTIGFADMRGNRQYVSLGNLADDDRVSLFLMDYPNRARLKLLGHARHLALDDPAELGPLLSEGMPAARIERFMLVRIVAFDWNCPQYITPRYTAEEIEPIVAPLKARIAELEAARRGSG